MRPWETESTEAKFVNGEWQSVYRLKLEPCTFRLSSIEHFLTFQPVPSQTAIYQSLEAAEKLRPAIKPGRTLSSLRAHFIDSGMRLQWKQ